MVPELTTEERREYLKKAMAARVVRSNIKKEVKQGKHTFEEVCGMPEAQKMRVFQLLCSFPHIWKAKARQIMGECGVPESRRVQGLGIRQKQKLAKAIADIELRYQ